MIRLHRFIGSAVLLGVTACSTICAAEQPGPEVPVNVAIDHYVSRQQGRDKIPVAEFASETTLIRRLSLDLIGRLPTWEETKSVLDSKYPQKWTLLVDRLMASPEFAYHQRNVIDEWLMEGKFDDAEWREYLLTATRENRPWDAIFRDVLLPDRESILHPGAAGFLRSRARELDDMTNDTSRLFFGVSISCAKCHDHPLVADWLQDHYFGLASFFNRTYLTKKRTIAEKFSGNVKFQTTSGDEKQARFMFLTGSAVTEPVVELTKEEVRAQAEEVKRQMRDADAPAAEVPAFSPREELVKLALTTGQDRFFARAIVNRVWHQYFGYGLVHPLDQMHSENPASHPELLDWLSNDLVSAGYDLKRLIRGIVLCDAYSRSSRWMSDEPIPAPETFAVANIRPLSPRQYALSLELAASDPSINPALMSPDQQIQWRERLAKKAEELAKFFEVPGEHFQVGVDEALLISNSDEINTRIINEGKDRLIERLLKLNGPQAVVQSVFHAVLSREPTEAERQSSVSYLKSRWDAPRDAIGQLLWALIASPELRVNY